MISTVNPRGRSPAPNIFVGTQSKQVIIGLLMTTALIAFEIFNFDTTAYALENLLGTVSFLGLKWATVLAIAFCAIDFAGLARIFTPEMGANEPKEIWYLTGAWLMGATLNAVMTWWAVSVSLLGRDLGNEILSRDQILTFVPIFVAVLVWLTRLMFIGAVSIAGEQIVWGSRQAQAEPAPAPRPVTRAVIRAKGNAPRQKAMIREASPSERIQNRTAQAPTVNPKAIQRSYRPSAHL